MPNKHGDFIWYELLTSDANAAQKFYGSVLEWSFADSGTPDMDYRIISAPEHHIAGVMAITKDMEDHGARPTWLGYIAVDDVDKCVESVQHGSGKTLMPAMDVPNVGRIAMIIIAQLAAPAPAVNGCGASKP